MLFQFPGSIETLWTFIANIVHCAFMLLHVSLKATFRAKLLLTNLTREPSAFVVWPQQMCLELVTPQKLFSTASTWERLCTSMNRNMTLHIKDCPKQFSTIRTWMRFCVAVHTSFMFLQIAGWWETFVANWTLVWFVSSVDSHVIVEMCRATKRLFTQVTFELFLSAVNSAVPTKVTSFRKSLSTNKTLKRFLSRMTSSVHC